MATRVSRHSPQHLDVWVYLGDYLYFLSSAWRSCVWLWSCRCHGRWWRPVRSGRSWPRGRRWRYVLGGEAWACAACLASLRLPPLILANIASLPLYILSLGISSSNRDACGGVWWNEKRETLKWRPRFGFEGDNLWHMGWGSSTSMITQLVVILPFWNWKILFFHVLSQKKMKNYCTLTSPEASVLGNWWNRAGGGGLTTPGLTLAGLTPPRLPHQLAQQVLLDLCCSDWPGDGLGKRKGRTWWLDWTHEFEIDEKRRELLDWLELTLETGSG